MPIVSSELVKYGAANRPQDDTSTAGGDIVAAARPTLAHFSANAVAALISDGTDTRTGTVFGRRDTGILDSEAFTLTSAVEVVLTKTWQYLTEVILDSADGARTVTVRQGSGGTTRATLVPNQTVSHIMFINSASEASPVTRYDLEYWRNDNATLTLTSAQVRLTADPASKIRIGVHTAKGSAGTITNRKTAPGGVTFVDDGVFQNVPTNQLAAAERIGLWIEQQLASSDTPRKETYTTELSGQTT